MFYRVPKILVPVMVLFAAHLFSQGRGTITGIVIDKKTERPLIGANVLVINTVLGASTDDNGNFVISNIPPGRYTIAVSMIGYRTERIDTILVRSGEEKRVRVLMEESVIMLDPVVITSSKYLHALGSSHQSVEVVGKLDIIGRQSRTVEGSLLGISGINFNEENISIRGSSGFSVYNVGSRVLLLVDGVAVLTSDMAAINWNCVPLLDIERIEVVKGAGSALYGSSAMGGTVNIITRRPTKSGTLRLRTVAGVYDRPHYKEWYWTDRLLYYQQLDIGYSRSMGPVDFRTSLSRHVSTGYMENNQEDMWNVSGKLVFRFPDHSTLDLYAAWMKCTRGGFIQWINQNSPFEVPPFNKNDEIHFNTLNLYAQYRMVVSSKLGLRFRISSILSQIGNQLTVYDPGVFRPGEGYGGELQADWMVGSSHFLISGCEFRWDISGSEYFGNHRGYTVSPYLQDEWSILPNLKISLGMRLDHHLLIGEEANSRLSPKIGINYRPSSGTTVRVSSGSGFRAATVFEKYIRADYSGFNIIPNPDLKPEYSWFFDFGLRQIFMKNSHIEFSLFQSDYWNMIEPVINFLGTIQFQNHVRARIRGVECEIESWLWKERIGFKADFTWMDPEDLYHKKTLPYRPKFSCNLQWTVKSGPISLQTEYRYISRIEEVQIHPLDPRVPVKLLFFRLRYLWKNLTLQLVINNALNYHSAQIERRMGEVRNISFGLIAGFGK